MISVLTGTIIMKQKANQTHREVLKSGVQLNIGMSMIPGSRKIAGHFHGQRDRLQQLTVGFYLCPFNHRPIQHIHTSCLHQSTTALHTSPTAPRPVLIKVHTHLLHRSCLLLIMGTIIIYWCSLLTLMLGTEFCKERKLQGMEFVEKWNLQEMEFARNGICKETILQFASECYIFSTLLIMLTNVQKWLTEYHTNSKVHLLTLLM